MERQPTQHHRSLFWPILLIGIGLLWLLGNLGDIAELNLPVLFRLWPVIIIFVGLDLVVGRRSPVIGALLGVFAILTIIAFIIFGNFLGLSSQSQPKTEDFTAPLAGVTSANVTLAFSDSPATVHALQAPADLIDARITYIGSINFRVTGTSRKSIQLARNPADFLLFNPIYWDPSLNWDIGLSPQVPLSLTVDGGTGESRVDLSGLRLSSLRASLNSGFSAFILPQSGVSPVELRGGAGATDWTIPPDAAFGLNIDGGSGSITLHLPPNPPARLEIRSSGLGKVSFPPKWQEVSPGKDNDEGTWQAASYAQAAKKIDIVVNRVGVGSIQIEAGPG